MEVDLITDVLVIGGGSAGCMAAIKAKHANPSLRVTVAEKAHAKRSGSISRGMDGMNIVAVPGISSSEEYVESMRIRCDGILDEELCYLMAAESYSIVKELEAWGVSFTKDDSGNYQLLKVHPKGRFLLPMVAPDLKVILLEQMQKAGVDIMNHTMAISLSSNDQRVTGATFLNTRTGDILSIEAKSTILATGPAGRFGLPSSGYLYGTYECPANSGDGYYLGYHAGAELTGFEYTMRSFLIKDFNGPLWYIVTTRGGKVFNGLGQELAADHLSSNRLISDVVVNEVHDGRGPIYMQLKHLSEETIEELEGVLFTTERPTQKKFFAGREIDFRKDWIELEQSEVYLCSGHGITGLVVDANAMTSLEGLLAAGDVAAVPMQHLTGAFVFGSIAGETAAKIASALKTEAVERKSSGHDRVNSILSQRGSIQLSSFEHKLRRMISQYLPSPKNEMRLRTVLSWIERFRNNFLNLAVRDSHELGRALELESIMDCAEMSAKASIERRESRWGLVHFRTDFPERDNQNYLKHIMIKKDQDTGQMTLFSRPPQANGRRRECL